MASIITADTGAVSGTAGLKQSADSSGVLALASGTGTTAVTIDTSQNVGIGTSSPSSKLQVAGDVRINTVGTATTGLPIYAKQTNNDQRGIWTESATTDSNGRFYCDNSVVGIAAAYSTTGSYLPITFTTSATERARIDSSGNLLVGTTDANQTSGVGLKMIYSATAPSFKTVLNTASGDTAYLLYNTNATNNGYRFYVAANGGISNFSANNTNLSDERVKTNIEVSGNYLDKICAIPVKLFNYKDEAENEQRTLGVIAQDVEAVAPELVNNEGFGETPEDGVPLKTIYQTDLQYALMKCIQEQQALITTLTERITALEGAQA